MSEVAIAFAIGVPILILFVIMVIVGRNQKKQSLRRSQARFVRQKAQDLTDALEFLMTVDNQREIQLCYMHRIDHLYKMHLQMLPKKDARNSATSFDKQSFEQKIRQEKPLRQIFRSDEEIYQARKQISVLLKALGPMGKQQRLNAATQVKYRRHLRALLLEREFASLIGLSDVSVQKQNKSMATEYLKLAKQRVLMIDFNYDPKADMIKQVNDKIAELHKSDQPQTRELEKRMKEDEGPDFDDAGFPLNPDADKRKF